MKQILSSAKPPLPLETALLLLYEVDSLPLFKKNVIPSPEVAGFKWTGDLCHKNSHHSEWFLRTVVSNRNKMWVTYIVKTCY